MYSPRFFNNLRIAFAIPTLLSIIVSIVCTFTIDTRHHGSLEGLVYIPVILFDTVLLGFTLTGIITFLTMVGKRKTMQFPIVWSGITTIICIFFAMFMLSQFRNPEAVLTVGGVLFPNLCVLMFGIIFSGE